MKKPQLFSLASLLILIVLFPPIYALDLDEEIERLEGFSEAYNRISQDFIEPIQRQDLIDAAIQGMIDRLDGYSEILHREDVDRIESISLGRYTGIGIGVERLNGVYTVTKVYRSSPAARAGIRSGDVLKRINGKDIGSFSREELDKIMKGASGTEIAIMFYHSEDPENVIEQAIIREVMEFDSVEAFETDGKIVTLQVHEFQKKTPSEIRRHLAKKKYEAVILDLRDNFGGLFLSGIETAELFLPVGRIIETRDQRGNIIETYVSRGTRDITEKILIVLTNRYSASSAEIVAGAIKDRRQGVLVGEKSFGKGVSQTIFPIRKDRYLKLTTSRFFMPSGISFDQVGITPHHVVEDQSGATRYQEADLPYQKALSLVRQRLNGN